MNSKALVSVIIPAYNAEAYIRQTLNSVLAQTYQSFEVIVVDDGSSDTTTLIVESFVKRDARFQLVRQSNAGVGAARNTAIRKSCGHYIAPLDADDLWFPEKLEKQVAHMEQCGVETGLVACWCKCIDEHGTLLHSPPWIKGAPSTIEGRLRHALVLRNLIGNASAPLIRAAALEETGLYLTRAEQGGAQGCEDWDLYLRISERFSIRIVPEHLLAYRLSSSSMSVNPACMEGSYVSMIRQARQRNPDLPSDTFQWSAGFFYQYISEKCYTWGQYAMCLRYLKKAVFANPILLIDLRIHTMFLESVFSVVTGSTVTHFGENYSAASYSITKYKFRFLNIVYKNIQNARWSAAYRDQT